jgi:hypothetical protein
MASASSKKLLKELPSEEEMRDILSDLSKLPDHNIALVGTAYLDHALELMLKAFFLDLSKEDEARLFDGAQGGYLGTMAAKIRLTYALGFFPEDVYADFLLINDIRNVFAHSLHRVSFDHELVKADCKKISAKAKSRRTLGIPEPTSAKEHFALAVLILFFATRMAIERSPKRPSPPSA